MAKRSRLPWLIIGGIILLVILIAALFLSSPSPPDNNTLSSHHLLNGFCGANRSSIPILHGRDQRPEGMAI